jgi:hypothetical protein
MKTHRQAYTYSHDWNYTCRGLCKLSKEKAEILRDLLQESRACSQSYGLAGRGGDRSKQRAKRTLSPMPMPMPMPMAQSDSMFAAKKPTIVEEADSSSSRWLALVNTAAASTTAMGASASSPQYMLPSIHDIVPKYTQPWPQQQQQQPAAAATTYTPISHQHTTSPVPSISQNAPSTPPPASRVTPSPVPSIPPEAPSHKAFTSASTSPCARKEHATIAPSHKSSFGLTTADSSAPLCTASSRFDHLRLTNNNSNNGSGAQHHGSHTDMVSRAKAQPQQVLPGLAALLSLHRPAHSGSAPMTLSANQSHHHANDSSSDSSGMAVASLCCPTHTPADSTNNNKERRTSSPQLHMPSRSLPTPAANASNNNNNIIINNKRARPDSDSSTNTSRSALPYDTVLAGHHVHTHNHTHSGSFLALALQDRSVLRTLDSESESVHRRQPLADSQLHEVLLHEMAAKRHKLAGWFSNMSALAHVGVAGGLYAHGLGVRDEDVMMMQELVNRAQSRGLPR